MFPKEADILIYVYIIVFLIKNIFINSYFHTHITKKASTLL